MLRWPDPIARQVAADVRFALTFKVGRSKRPLTDTERDLVAAAVVEHLQLANWLIERGEPAKDGTAFSRRGGGPARNTKPQMFCLTGRQAEAPSVKVSGPADQP